MSGPTSDVTRRAVDHAVRATLERLDLDEVVDLPALVAHLTACYEPRRVEVVELRGPDGACPAWTAACHALADLPPLPVVAAVAAARVVDDLYDDTTPLPRSGDVADVGLHVRRATPDPTVGRVLAQLVRVGRATTVVAVGADYGAAAVHLAEAVRHQGRGRVHLVEAGCPEVEVCDRVLAPWSDVITRHSGPAADLLRRVLADVAPVHLVHHVGPVDRTRLEDLAAAAAPDAMVVVEGPDLGAAPWTDLLAHPAVVAAATTDVGFGLVQVRG